MKHNIPVPETIELETLIASTFDAVPGPDHVHMQSIRDALNIARTGTRSQKSLNKLFWWTVLLLTGGLAMAGTWLVRDMLLNDTIDAPQVTKEQPNSADASTAKENRHLDHIKAPYEEPYMKSPVIYQREGE